MSLTRKQQLNCCSSMDTYLWRKENRRREALYGCLKDGIWYVSGSLPKNNKGEIVLAV